MTLAYLVIVTLIAACLVLLLAYRRALHRASDLYAQTQQALRMTMQQQRMLREHRHADTVKNEFISTVSHELRTPLTSIRGALGLLSTGMLGQVDSKAQNLLRIASTNTDRLVRLINDILDLDRMDSDEGTLQSHRCSLPELIVQAVETMMPMAEAAGVRLEVVPDPHFIAFDGDPDRILQLLCNLLSNAIKFSPAGAPVRLITSISGTDFVLCVEDRGRGIPAENLDSIFDRFKQVDPGDSRQKGGTGLGLAICRSIAVQHGGAIWAERNDALAPGREGSSFFLQLPRLITTEVVRLFEQPAGLVLVCDDDAAIRHISASLLRQHGYTVLEAEGGEQAVQLASHHPVAAILLDLYMPGLSGWETLERLKAHASTARIPVVVLSALSPAARVSNAPPLISTAQGWVQKPFTETVLLAELRRVLQSDNGPGRVLFVEDDIDLATVVLSGFEARCVEGEEIDIEHVSTLSGARKSCLVKVPDLLLLDLTLPDGNGFSFVDWMRKQPTLSNLPVIVYSGSRLTEPEMEQLRLGPTQFLIKDRQKPADVEDLIITMVRHLRTPLQQTCA